MLSKRGTQTSIRISVACRYEGSYDILFVLSNLDATAITADMDTFSIQALSRNGPSKRWTIIHRKIVTMTLAGLYFAGQGKIVAVTCRDPILVQIVLFESSPSIEGIKLLFSSRGLELLCDYIGEELIWEGQYL